MLEELTGKPVLGVVPMEKIDVDDEDSLSDRLNQKTITEGIDVAVIRLPHISYTKRCKIAPIPSPKKFPRAAPSTPIRTPIPA